MGASEHGPGLFSDHQQLKMCLNRMGGLPFRDAALDLLAYNP